MIARFLDIRARRLFCLHSPAAAHRPQYRVLVVPPFAEELNKCRRMLALTTRQLSMQGCDVLWPDLYGTGDSAGEFGDAVWADWVADLGASLNGTRHRRQWRYRPSSRCAVGRCCSARHTPGPPHQNP